LAELNIDFNSLVAELPNVLTQACIHFTAGTETLYKGAVLKVKEIFFRNIEILLIRTCVKDVAAGKKAVPSGSETYKSSFPDFKGWETAHDLLLLRSVSNNGFGRWREVLIGLIPGKDAHDVYKLVHLEDASLDHAAIYAKMEQFVEQRTRFLVYCLMEDEYLTCEGR